MPKFRIAVLDVSSPSLVNACVSLLVHAFAKPKRYSAPRLSEELQAVSPLFYRQFFVALADGKIIGIGGVKAADWASHTHQLYLSAVAPAYRGQGVGRALLKARLDWVRENFTTGRILVSSPKAKRFHEFGFVDISNGAIDGRHLMICRF